MAIAEFAHWGLALVPVLVFLAALVWLDAFELMSLRELLVLLVLGAIAAAGFDDGHYRKTEWLASLKIL